MNPKDQIKENLSITDVVSTYIRLEKSGGQFRARCPFHNEKTPSFYVSPERKSFHCFGCQTHGDIFTFVEKIENIPFYDAMKILADRAGVSLKDKEKNQEDMRLVALLKDSTDHFEKNLAGSPEARAYLLDRGLTDDTIKLFHVGYAKNEWRDLFISLAGKGYSPEEMEVSGIEIKALDANGKVKGWYDRFRGRIMFPIRNVSGATVGYSGRIMPQFVDPSVAQGKYVNTPETPLYHKSKILFGYDTARKAMAETKQVVVVEGQMDLCMSYQAGVHNTVAVSGTAFTDEHIHIIKRFCDTVILSFDTDQAGQTALKKTALLCLLGGLDVYVVGAFGTKDPADLIKEDKDAWLSAVKNKKHVIERMIDVVMEEEKDERVRNKRVVTDVLPFVRAVQSPIDRAHFLKMISIKTGIVETIIFEEMSRVTAPTPGVEEAKNVIVVPPLERLTKELVAYCRLKNKQNDEKYMELAIDEAQFPDLLIQEEMFAIEKKPIDDEERHYRSLIESYYKLSYSDEEKRIREKYTGEGADSAAITKEHADFKKRSTEKMKELAEYVKECKRR
jgi:DNA primase